MHWIAPSEKDALTETFEKRLWDARRFRSEEDWGKRTDSSARSCPNCWMNSTAFLLLEKYIKFDVASKWNLL